MTHRLNDKWFQGIILAVIVIFITGCESQKAKPFTLERSALYDRSAPKIVSAPKTAAVVKTPASLVAGYSVQGRPIHYEILGTGSDRVLIMATIHGNEPAGTPLVRKLSEYLRANPQLLSGRTVMLMPVANPDGLAANTRANARGVDLNRNFPATNRSNNHRHGYAGLSEPESRHIYNLIKSFRPNRVISIHQPLACIDYDGPGRLLAERIAQKTNLPVRKLGAMEGSMGAWLGSDLGVPVITMELPSGVQSQAADRLWSQYGGSLMTAISYPGYAN